MEAHALPHCEAPAVFDRMNPSHAKSEDVMQRGERRKTRIWRDLAKEPCVGFWCDSQEHPVKVAAVLRSAGSRRNQTKSDLRLRALASEKRCLCATTRQCGGIKPTNLHNFMIWISLKACLPEDGSECMRLKTVQEKWHLYVKNLQVQILFFKEKCGI